MRKTIFIVFATLCTAVLLCSCGKTDVVAPEGGSRVNIALILDPAAKADETYNRQLVQAVEYIGKHNKGRVTTEVIQIPGSGLDRKAYIEEQIKKGKYDLVIDSDLYYTRNLVEMSGSYPEQKFVIVDENVATAGKTSNMLLIRFAPFQMGFMAGYAVAEKAARAVTIICLKDSPNSRSLVKGFKKGISYAGKALQVDVRQIELPDYDIVSVLMNGQRLRNSAYAAAQQAVAAGSEVVLVDYLVPVDPVLSALQGTDAKAVLTGCVSDHHKEEQNFLGCIANNYERGVQLALTQVLEKGFRAGALEMDFSNEGMTYYFNDETLMDKCGKLAALIKADAGKFNKMEDEQ